MSLDFTDYDVPVHTQGALTRYYEHGLYPGSFLESVICNDLVGAVARADGFNRACLTDIVCFMIDRMPSNSWGSPEEMAHWIQSHYELEA